MLTPLLTTLSFCLYTSLPCPQTACAFSVRRRTAPLLVRTQENAESVTVLAEFYEMAESNEQVHEASVPQELAGGPLEVCCGIIKC